ncbi:MAG: ABC transporter substrate-binding protein [Syntrophomonas sp.]
MMMKKAVWLVAVLLVVAAGLFYWNESSGPPPPERITLANPLGPAVIPVTGISGNQVKGTTPIEIKFWNEPSEAIAMLSANKADFAVLPITNAANIYAKGTDITLLGVHEWKVFYLLAAPDTPFDGWKSLVDKRVYTANGRGQTVDVLMRSAMSKEGVKPDQDVKILYASPQDIVALFKAGKVDFAALPEPFATLAMAGSNGKIVLDFQKYWGESTGKPERIPVAGLFVKRSFMEKYPAETKEVAQVFSQSTQWSGKNVSQALDIAGKTLPIPKPVMQKALTRIDFHYVPISECREEVQFFLEKMNQLYPPGTPKLPDKGFYSE